MNRRRLVHIQIALLAVLVLLVFAQAFGPAGGPDGDIVFDDIDAHELRRQAFELDAPAELHVRAAGSLGTANDTLLAAHAWILDASTLRPAWRLHPQTRARSGRIVRADTTIRLSGGKYIAYYASLGPSLTERQSRSFLDRLFGKSESWTSDASEWELVIQHPENTGFRTLDQDEVRDDEHVLWTTGKAGNNESMKEWLLVSDSIRAHLYAIGEIGDRVYDYGWIRPAEDSVDLWIFSEEVTSWAGGAPANRFFEGGIELAPGIYEVGYLSDGGHAYSSWRANPPFDPSGWGMTLRAADGFKPGSVRTFDPWTQAWSVIEMIGIGSDEERSVSLQVEAEVDVVIHALGEIGRTRYDYGTLLDLDRYQTVWEMTDERAVAAGGHRNNRREIALRTLQPGHYRLEYRTDGSHAYGDWRHSKPDHPERWGVSVFTLDSTAAARISTLDSTASIDPPAPPQTPARGNVLLDATELSNDQRIRREFRLREEASLQITALGEITLVNRFDYGWIERADDGATVWEMTYDNTIHAGGDSRNRMFRGVVTLPAGDYVAHFVTDHSYAYGDFRSEDEQPGDPSAWGITIQRQ